MCSLTELFYVNYFRRLSEVVKCVPTVLKYRLKWNKVWKTLTRGFTQIRLFSWMMRFIGVIIKICGVYFQSGLLKLCVVTLI